MVTWLGDGNRGWPEQAPFERIIVAAAGTEVPQALKDQLAPGGIMGILDGLMRRATPTPARTKEAGQ